MEKRTKRVSIRVNPREFEQIDKKAKEIGMTISNLARFLLLHANIKAETS